MNKTLLRLTLISILSFALFTSCKEDDEIVSLPDHLEYAGSEQCASCHSTIHQNFVESGHPFKVMKVVNGQQPIIPFMPTALTPTGYSWGDLSYTIGGYGWKMRFIDNNGYVITQVAGSQWNPANNTQTIYNGSVANGTEKYTCGGCHTTGWKSIADGGTAQDGLPGMDGQFFVGGVHCEACHGQGNVHIAAKTNKMKVPTGFDISKDNTKALCAKCHERRFVTHDLKQQTSGGWEMHRCQIEQLSTNAHNSLECATCHDPHASTKKDNLAKGNGIKLDKTCTSCHTTSKYSTTMHFGATCIQCHMPKTVKNGISYNKYLGDAPNHNFKINTSATDSYLTPDGANVLWANVNKKGSTLDFACYQCHKDAAGIGGTASTKTRTELTTKALTFHK